MYVSKIDLHNSVLNEENQKLIADIKSAIEYLGKKKISMASYHDNDIVDRYTFFGVDNNGYGVEAFINEIEVNDNGVFISFEDSEVCWEMLRCIEDLTTTELLYVLSELEELCMYKDDNPDHEILSEYEVEDCVYIDVDKIV